MPKKDISRNHTFKQPFKSFSIGFTLIELLIVVAVLGIITAIGLSVLNPAAIRNRSEDGVRLSNLTKIVQGIEAYVAAEGRYPYDNPSDTFGAGNPLDDPVANDVLSTYLSSWPNGEPAAGDTYLYNSNAGPEGTANGGSFFGVVIATSDGTNFYKYHTNFNPPSIQTCTNGDPSSASCN